jgi:hypothetical protein
MTPEDRKEDGPEERSEYSNRNVRARVPYAKHVTDHVYVTIRVTEKNGTLQR